MKLIINLTAILTLFGIFFGAWVYLNDAHASKDEFSEFSSKVEKYMVVMDLRMDHKIISDQREAYQERVWEYERQLNDNPDDVDLKIKKQEAEDKVEKFDERLKAIDDKTLELM